MQVGERAKSRRPRTCRRKDLARANVKAGTGNIEAAG
jgi:hypothetical protein